MRGGEDGGSREPPTEVGSNRSLGSGDFGSNLGLLDLDVTALGQRLLVVGQNAALGLAGVQLADQRGDEVVTVEAIGSMLGEHVDDDARLRGELVALGDGLQELEDVDGLRLGSLYGFLGRNGGRSDVSGFLCFLGGFFGHDVMLSVYVLMLYKRLEDELLNDVISILPDECPSKCNLYRGFDLFAGFILYSPDEYTFATSLSDLLSPVYSYLFMITVPV